MNNWQKIASLSAFSLFALSAGAWGLARAAEAPGTNAGSSQPTATSKDSASFNRFHQPGCPLYCSEEAGRCRFQDGTCRNTCNECFCKIAGGHHDPTCP